MPLTSQVLVRYVTRGIGVRKVIVSQRPSIPLHTCICKRPYCVDDKDNNVQPLIKPKVPTWKYLLVGFGLLHVCIIAAKYSHRRSQSDREN